MKSRKDGEETRQKILLAASQIFAEKGFHKATHAEICRLANANTAAINYHFGSKDELYRATWVFLASLADTLYPIHGNVPPSAPLEMRLRGLVNSLLLRKSDETQLSNFHRIQMRELIEPTGLVDDLIAQWIQKTRNYTRGIIKELLGDLATDEDIELCEMSLISQCFMAQGPAWRKKRHVLWKFKNNLERLVNHILYFFLAGIEAMRKEIKSRNHSVTIENNSFFSGDPHTT